jgi:hypothetical protein
VRAVKFASTTWAFVKFADLSLHLSSYERRLTYCGQDIHPIQKDIALPVERFLRDEAWFLRNVCPTCLLEGVSNFETLKPILKKVNAAGQVGL